MSSERYISNLIRRFAFARHKMCFISGPRQVGKTTLAKGFLAERGHGKYWSWDETVFRRLWVKNPSEAIQAAAPGVCPVIVLDEIHKAKGWKRTLKGVFDTLDAPVDLIVTGSARMDVYKKGSDSLLGRYIPIRLHPLSVGELLETGEKSPTEFLAALRKPHEAHSHKASQYLARLLEYGGFPEPYYTQNPDYSNVWRRTRVEQLVREDLRDISRLPELSQIEMLVALLPERAGQALSRQSLSEDLEVAYTTVSRWLLYLSALYYHFEVRPFANKIKNSLKREGKLYLWDYSEVPVLGARFENLVAAHLLKACHYWTDCGKGSFELRYLRNKGGREIDFLIVKDTKAWQPVEVKSGDVRPSPNWRIFMPQIGCDLGVQLVRESGVDKSYEEAGKTVRILSAGAFLEGLP